MNENEITHLARQIRLETLKMLTQLGFGHYGGSMSVVETLAVLYGAVMKIDPATRTGQSVTTLSCQKDMLVRRCTAPWRSKVTSRWKS